MKKPALLTGAVTAALLFALSNAGTFAQSTNAAAPMPMSMGQGQGVDGFGKTNDFDAGNLFEDVYNRGFYCDTSVPAKSASGCEVGVKYNKPPARQFDPLFITVPLGFKVDPMDMQCPNGLVCIDHPATIDLSAIGGPGNAMTPGHDHFTTTTNQFQPEYWNVVVIGVTSHKTYAEIRAHRTYAYIQYLIAKGDKTVSKPIQTNLFLFFAVKPPPQ